MTINKSVHFSELFPLIEETIKKGDSFSFLAFGNSMKPYIKNGTHIVTLSPITTPCKKNDVIFYRRDDGPFVLHRIVAIEKNGTFTLCGDNQFSLEKGVRKDQIIARLSALEKNGKKIPIDSFDTDLWCFFLPIRRGMIRIYSYLRKLIKK